MSSWFGGGSKKKEEPVMQPPPVVFNSQESDDPERLQRIGRSALISSSSRGVLGNVTASNKKLSV